jgi:hypothetical protein
MLQRHSLGSVHINFMADETAHLVRACLLDLDLWHLIDDNSISTEIV